jgi:hypothetical protein
LSIARAGAREGPSTSTLLLDRKELLSSAMSNFLPRPDRRLNRRPDYLGPTYD